MAGRTKSDGWPKQGALAPRTPVHRLLPQRFSTSRGYRLERLEGACARVCVSWAGGVPGEKMPFSYWSCELVFFFTF